MNLPALLRRLRPRRALPFGFALLLTAGPMLAAGVALASPANPYEWAGNRPFDLTAPIDQVIDAAATSSASALPSSILSGADGEWVRVAPPRGVRRLQPSMIFDPIRNRLVSFGGSDQDTTGLVYTNTVSTLQLPGGAWVALATLGTPPPARRLHRAVYDPNGDRMIVYGGWNDALLDDVWQLTLSGIPTWSQLTPTGGGPGARAGCGVIYDASAQRMLVFGGFDGVTAPAGRASDVWALSLTGPPDWSQLVAPDAGPPGRSSVSAAYDPSGPAMLVFGGSDTGYSNELWKLSLSATPAWSLVSTSGAPPTPREEQIAQFAAGTHRLAVYGGYDDTQVLGDLWILDFSTATPAWSRAFPTPCIERRWGAGSALDASGVLYLQGGVAAYGWVLGDYWKVSVAIPTTWSSYEQLLPPRLQEVMVLDTKRDRLVVFGGTDGSYRNDTYTHSMVHGTGWDFLSTLGSPPPARRLHTGIYDPVGDRLIVFGGYDDTLLGDLWQLSFAGTPTWSPLAATGGGPSPRGGHVAVYDPEGQRMVLFGGYDGVSAPANRIGDTWELSLSGSPAWTQLATGPGPSARSSATAVYDAAHHGMVVFGGTDPGYRNDAWRLALDSPPSWSLIAAGNPAPGAREEQSAAYDSKRDRMLVFGGYNSSVINYGDLWSLGLGDSPGWSQPAPSQAGPSPRWGMKALYDSKRDGMWLYGGWSYGYERDLWMLQWFDDPVNVAILGSTSNAEVGVAHLAWNLPSSVSQPAIIERSSNGTSWSAVGAALPARSGRIAFDDHTAPPNQSLAWRARVRAAGDSYSTDAVWMTVPGSTTGVDPGTVAFALRPAGRAESPGAIAVECSLPRAGTARIELLDVAGRRLAGQDLSSAGSGRHRVELGERLPAGLFFARLTFGSESATLRIARLP